MYHSLGNMFPGEFLARKVAETMGYDDKNDTKLSMEELERKQEELKMKEKELNEKESLLKKAEENITKGKHNLYDKIEVSLGTLDKIIGVLVICLIVVIMYAVF